MHSSKSPASFPTPPPEPQTNNVCDWPTSSTTGVVASGKASNMNDSNLIPLLACGATVLPSGPAKGIFFSATWYTCGGSATTRCSGTWRQYVCTYGHTRGGVRPCHTVTSVHTCARTQHTYDYREDHHNAARTQLSPSGASEHAKERTGVVHSSLIFHFSH
jgi:hypothetical protein